MSIKKILYQHDLCNLFKVCTFLKNSSKLISIDLFLTTKNTHFQNTVAVWSGISDFHKLVLTVSKTSFGKNKRCQILYRGYKDFNSEYFNEDLQDTLSTTQINTCKQFEDIFLSVLKIYAPLKKKLLIENHSQYVTKVFRKGITRRSKLEKIYFKKQTNESLKAYKKKYYWSNLYNKERKKLFDNLNGNVVSDNKTFWKVTKPFFKSKSAFGRNTKLIEKEEILKDDTKIAEELNLFFSNAVKFLNIVENTYIINSVSDNLKDPVTGAIENLKTHPNVLIIKDKIFQGNKFSFTEVFQSEIEKEIKNLNVKKATTNKNVPPKV